MPLRLDIDQQGVEAIAAGWQQVSARSEDLRPLGFPARDRWLESERRLFGRHPWPPKSASTRRRYRYPIRQFGTGRTIRPDPGAPPLTLSGHLEDTLTRRGEPGQLDRVDAHPGRVELTLGLKARGDAAYGHYQRKYGRNPLNFDPVAHEEATGDVVEYLIGHHAGRR